MSNLSYSHVHFSRVTSVDGDTIDVDIAGTTYRVRYIGMDTPERGDFFYHEATEANQLRPFLPYYLYSARTARPELW